MQLLQADKYYHIYNHANGRENLFCMQENYNFFLAKYHIYITPIAETFAYCLMPNHFHLCIKIRSEDDLLIFFKEKIERKLLKNNIKNFPKVSNFWKVEETRKLISKQFSNLFSSYTQAFNKQQNRKGNLFQSNFKRKEITSKNYLRSVIFYIHNNPIHHDFVEDIRDWQHSSFESFFSDKVSSLKREEVIKLFENKKNFEEYHKKEINDNIAIDFEF